MDPALRAQIRPFVPTDKLRGFLMKVDHRDPMAMRAHMYHWIELARNPGRAEHESDCATLVEQYF